MEHHSKRFGFLPIKTVSSVCSNLFATGNADKRSLMSPMTELSVNLELSSMSTPRRRLSLSETGTPTPEKLNIASSMESGIEVESPLTVCPDFDSPTLENIRNRKKLSKTSSVGSFNMRRRILSQRSFSSPVMVRKPLEPLNFNDCIDNGEENHSDISLCEMSDQFPDFEDCNFKASKLKTVRSLSAPPVFDEFLHKDFDVCSNTSEEDDGFFDEISRDTELEFIQFSSSVPSNLMGLIAAPIVLRRNSSVGDEDKENTSPVSKDQDKTVFTKPVGLPIRQKRSKSFSVKRDNPSTDFSPSPVSRKKKPRLFRSQSVFNVNPVFQSVQQQNSKPATAAPLKCKALTRSQSFDTHTTKSPSVDITKLLDMDDKNLVGDKSREYCLPTSDSKHPDLKAITPETLSDVLNGKYKDMIDDVHIIDCRYPYEFEGGHIKGAINIYQKDVMSEKFVKEPKSTKEKKQILVFHCEFSSKRGPAMCRFLRNQDRDIHQCSYPQLYYPEMYLLEGGYKEFFEKKKEFCEPECYREMIDPEFNQQLKLFAKKSKSWNDGDSKIARSRRTGLRY